MHANGLNFFEDELEPKCQLLMEELLFQQCFPSLPHPKSNDDSRFSQNQTAAYSETLIIGPD